MFDAISVAYGIALGIYFFISARRIFSQSAAKTAVKSVLFVAGARH